jgi:hypothetical protein
MPDRGLMGAVMVVLLYYSPVLIRPKDSYGMESLEAHPVLGHRFGNTASTTNQIERLGPCTKMREFIYYSERTAGCKKTEKEEQEGMCFRSLRRFIAL